MAVSYFRTTDAPPPRPSVARRRAACQLFLIAAYADGQGVLEAVEQLAAMRTAEPERYIRLVGTDRPLSQETLLNYWAQLPTSLRETLGSLRRSSRARPTKARIRRSPIPAQHTDELR